MALVSVPLAPGKADEALALFKDHEFGIKYTMSMKGAVQFDFGLETAEDGSETMHIFEYWHEVEDYEAYIAKRGDGRRIRGFHRIGDAGFPERPHHCVLATRRMEGRLRNTVWAAEPHRQPRPGRKLRSELR